MALDPAIDDKSFNVFILAGQESPGVCKFSFPTRDYGWDLVQAKGSDGGETILNSAKLVEFEVELTLWQDDTVNHFERWDLFKKILETPVKDGDKKALDIWHPQLEPLGIRSVVVKSRTEPQSTGPGGASVVKIKFLEYAPKKKKPGSGKPKGSKGAGGGKDDKGGPSDTNRDLKDELKEHSEFLRRQNNGEDISADETWGILRK